MPHLVEWERDIETSTVLHILSLLTGKEHHITTSISIHIPQGRKLAEMSTANVMSVASIPGLHKPLTKEDLKESTIL